jgi:hypothetical protein
MENQLNSTRTFLYWLSLPLVVLFLLYIGGGYYFSFSTVLHNSSNLVIFGLTVPLICVVYIYASGIPVVGSRRHETWRGIDDICGSVRSFFYFYSVVTVS